MKILAIETSCDETAVAIVEDGRKVLANTIASQVDIHAKTGGVVPEVAAREHVLKMLPVLDQCLEEVFGKADWGQIDALAITQGPGLVSSLIIGTETASVVSYVKDIPLIPVHHIKGHIYSNWLGHEDEVQFPLMILTVSGGHNELILMRGHGDFEVLGETLDDAAGEAFDKVARLLGLGYPGGPAIAKIAEEGDASRYKLPRILLEKDSLNFSFSGLKTAVLDLVRKEVAEGQDSADRERLSATKDREIQLDPQLQADVAASFQEAAVETLATKLLRAYEQHPEVKELHLAGGVSANIRLRELITEKLGDRITFRHPKSIHFCTDNAAMIGAAAYFQYQKNPQEFKAKTNVVPSTSFNL
jgi:N6-L-threonylcarbamoyladenine synthase